MFHYPITEFGPLMKGMLIGGLGIFHVFLAQFAIGSGFLMTYMEHRASGPQPAAEAETFVDSFFRYLVLISFVTGALTGVGLWLVSIQVSPRTIGLMVDAFHWVWAIEWTFFAVEVIAGYAYLRYRAILAPRVRVGLLMTYSLAGWFSLFWINGILSWQLTPGEWVTTRDVWAGFFNPSFFPSLLFRTVAALAISAIVAAIVINTLDVQRSARESLLRHTSRFMGPMVAMPLLAVWFLMVMPEDSRGWVLGGSPAMTLFLLGGAAAAALVGAYALVALLFQRLYVNGATATLLLALAFAATAGGEFVREGSRKPFTVRQVLYANAITPDEVATLRARGSVTDDPYPLRGGEALPNDQVRLGARVYRFQCSVCHTLEGANGVVHLTATWTTDQSRLNLAQLQRTKPFMPPFAGSPQELEALVQFLSWSSASRPASWPITDDPAVIEDIRRWIEQAGAQKGGS
jgi:cytochrome bd ubiquinol oxidase subunit I